jgi:hypothetical protein
MVCTAEETPDSSSYRGFNYNLNHNRSLICRWLTEKSTLTRKKVRLWLQKLKRRRKKVRKMLTKKQKTLPKALQEKIMKAKGKKKKGKKK